MIGAIVRQEIVENLIVIDAANVAEMATALKCEIIDAAPYGLQTGDLRTANGWTRNAGGEQMILPLLEGENGAASENGSGGGGAGTNVNGSSSFYSGGADYSGCVILYKAKK